MFDAHEEDFRKADNAIRELSVKATTAVDKPEVQKQCLEQAKEALASAEKAIEGMNDELRRTVGNKAQASNKAKQHRATMASLKRIVKELGGSVQRSTLLGEAGKGPPTGRQRLNDTAERLQEGSNRIDDARRVALETEEIGIDVMADLRGQRDVILRTRNHMGDIDSNLEASRRTLTAMGRRVVTNKVILGAIVVVLFICLILELVLKLKRGR